MSNVEPALNLAHVVMIFQNLLLVFAHLQIKLVFPVEKFQCFFVFLFDVLQLNGSVYFWISTNTIGITANEIFCKKNG